MQTKEKGNLAIDEALLDQALDHILNSPDDEFITYARETLNLDPEYMAVANSAAALKALDEQNMKNVLASSNIDPAKVRFRPSSMVKTPEQNRSYVDRFIENAKVLGYKFSNEFLSGLTENTLQQKMAFKSKTHRETRSRKKSQP